MLVNVKDFNAYSGNMESTQAENEMKISMLLSAEKIVVEYLGYEPSVQSREDIISGICSNRCYVHSMKIEELEAVKIDGRDYDISEFDVFKDYITFKNRTAFPRGIDNIVLNYRSGWEEDSLEMNLIKLTIKRIASLMLLETNGNIGLTGRSFSDQSRTYVSYNNYSKYLQPLGSIAVLRFE